MYGPTQGEWLTMVILFAAFCAAVGGGVVGLLMWIF